MKPAPELPRVPLFTRRLVVQLTLITALYLAASPFAYRWLMTYQTAYWHYQNSPAAAQGRDLTPFGN